MTARPPVLLGTAYYPEYRTTPDIARELDLMVRAGIGVIRVGESTWSDWEPTDGTFAFDPLVDLLDAAHQRGLRVVVGTPTYAVPPWLQRAHPEIAAVRADGTAVPWGARQEIDITSPVFRRYAERIVREMLGRVGDHPAVIGVQLDNEPGLLLLHNDHLHDRFRRRLQERYGDVATLNREWGLSYWSHRLTDWDQLWTAAGNSTPAYELEWRRFQADLTTEYLRWQYDIARPLVPGDRFLTTCVAYNRPAVDDRGIGDALDVVGGNAYYLPQDHLAADTPAGDGPVQWYAQTMSGLWQLADRMWASKAAPFLVTETGAGPIDMSAQELPPYPGQLRQAALALIARGARMISYWQWQTLRSGAEIHWGGILPRTDRPGRIYAEVRALGEELDALGPALTGLTPDADVGMLWSTDDRWMGAAQPPFALAGSATPDRQAYERTVDTYYRGAVDAGCQVRFLHPEDLADPDALLAQLPGLILPRAAVLSDAHAEALAAYVAAGGHLLLGTGVATYDELGRGRGDRGRIDELAGARATESSTLREPVTVTRVPADSWFGSADDDYRMSRRIDLLEPGTAVPVLDTAHPFFAAWPAAVRNRYGAGTVLSLAGLPDRALARDAVRALVPRPRTLGALPDAVTAHSAVRQDGERVWFLHNWAWEPAEVRPDRPVRAARTGEPVTALSLGSWDVAVVIEEASG